MKKDKRIDDYIKKAAPFARPVLIHFRELVHKTCPDAEEKMKWSFPHFDYKNEMMCSIAAFKNHCAIGFWKASLMNDNKTMKQGNEEAMGHYGRITSLKDLPSDKKIVSHIKEAMRLNAEGIKLVKTKPVVAKAVVIPEGLSKALNKEKIAKDVFNKFSPSHQREYIEWINEAKTDATRNKRLETTIEWLKEGKSRLWKYERKKTT
jgi:uncharacterized protein YdeI (YjbR/CyaY-like superfamily)